MDPCPANSSIQAALDALPKPSDKGPSAAEVWGIGLVAVTIINSCAAVGIAIMPLLGRRSCHYVLMCLIGLGVGSLSGSALFHLLPEAFQLDGSNHDILWKAWTAISGVYLFFLVDKFLKIVVKLRKQRRQRAIASSTEKTGISTICQNVNSSTSPDSKMEKDRSLYGNSNIDGSSNNNNESVADSTEAVLSKNELKADSKEIAPVAWMIIFGDAIHNFVDGLSIGAAFTDSVLSGVSVCVAVICEEFPHEFGDIAILVSSGMTMRKALGYNVLSAMTCYLGFIIGVLVGELSEATVYIFALAAGMFLYVSLVNMIPEMNEAVERAMEVNMRRGLILFALQFIGIAAGLTIMFLLAFFESHIKFD